MKIGIVGSRRYENKKKIKDFIFKLKQEHGTDTIIVSGGCKNGADKYDKKYAFESGGNIDTDNGTWFATPDNPQVLAGNDLRVLIGQFTTYGWDSQITGVINLQGKIGDSETFVARAQYINTFIPPPASIALLGIASLFQRRRR